MKGLLLKLVLSKSIKLGINYSYEATVAVIAALRGVLQYGEISDENRRRIGTVITALDAVREFLGKVTVIIGVVTIGLSDSDHLEDMTVKLRKITDSL